MTRTDKKPAGDQFKVRRADWIATRKPIGPKPLTVPNIQNHY